MRAHVVALWTARGTHRGDWGMELGTIPLTEKATATPGSSSFYLQAGKIIHDVNHIHFVSLLEQIGARIDATAAQSV